ncbi:MAG TPA: GNAT family N-acetyltransferase, partial [Myxococcota bacterium]|nr:GNAT family N-acetyltransferase [Myxococcota bacterium]
MTLTHIKRLDSGEVLLLRQLNEVFAAAFDEPEVYALAPADAYVEAVLGKSHVIVLVALVGERVVGGLVAYVLEKLEQARSEVYLYDLAVAEAHRRQGIARALVTALKPIAKRAGAAVIFVQADRSDGPAIALYRSMGVQE